MKDSQGTRGGVGGDGPLCISAGKPRSSGAEAAIFFPPGQALSIRLPSPSLESRMLMWHAKFSYFRTVCMHRRDSQGGRD